MQTSTKQRLCPVCMSDNDYFDKNNYFKYAFEYLHMMFLFG